jgi:replicative DNA helicase
LSEVLEKGVLGCAVLSEEAALSVVSGLDQSDFSIPQYRTIFTAICGLVDSGEDVSTTSVIGHLHGLGIATCDYEVFTIADELPDYHAHEQYIEQLKNVSARGKLEQLQKTISSKLNSEGDVQSVLDYAQSSLEKIRDASEKEIEWVESQGLSEIIITSLSREVGEAGLPSGLTKLDQHTNGFCPGQLIVIAGRPGMGKTSLACRILLSVCFVKKEPADFYSIEMTNHELAYRMCALDMEIPHDNLRKNMLTDEQKRKLTLWATDIVPNSKLRIRDSGVYIEDLCYKARRSAKKGLSMIMIDYLQLIKTRHKAGTRDQEIGYITGLLKGLAKQLKIPVILLCQLNRLPEKREDKRPNLGDLRESGNIEQDADLVIFLYRDGYYTVVNYQEQAELIIAKQRAGETGTVKVWWNGSLMSFQNNPD